MSKNKAATNNKVATDENRKAVTVMDTAREAMIARLKTSKFQGQNEDRQAGCRCGDYWVEEKANYPMIQMLKRYEHDIELAPGRWEDSGWVLAEKMAIHLKGRNFDNNYVEELKGYLFGDADRKYSESFVRGFVEGAIYRYDEVTSAVG